MKRKLAEIDVSGLNEKEIENRARKLGGWIRYDHQGRCLIVVEEKIDNPELIRSDSDI